MSELLVNTIKKADGTGQLTVPAESGTVVVKDGSNDVTLNDITAGGIYLGGTGSANKLEDYEEGTWTPTFQNGANVYTGSYANQSGVYTKIGRFVYIECIVQASSSLTSNGLTGGSDIEIHGLPFPCNDVAQVPFMHDSTRFDFGSSYSYVTGFVQNNGNTYVRFRANGDDVSVNNITTSQFEAGSRFTQWCAVYRTDS